MSYFKLILAGLLEIGWAYTMTLSHGFTRLWPTLITIVILFVSFYLLESVINEFGVGVSYAVFTGIGTAGTSIVGMLFLHESHQPLKIVALVILLIGIIGLKLADDLPTKKAGDQ
ncbi:DMT family transporter [Agrilactobacillus fermenti]|uniref:DMT family transporter n=1 Tax=Agrilactobacillus fermenti TaxID=2586909 RepID=UPI001E4C4301|nr:multidrug efflux SMR transporter [Agrilactobacillus fermenti]MCD2256759.1 multidrug efflux SMR transporter [Agrilactobacillus fermenti]